MKIVWFGDEPVSLKELFNPLALLRGIELRERAERTFGDKSVAMRWLIRPNRALEGKEPLDLATRSDDGLRRVQTVLGRIEHGIYS